MGYWGIKVKVKLMKKIYAFGFLFSKMGYDNETVSHIRVMMES